MGYGIRALLPVDSSSNVFSSFCNFDGSREEAHELGAFSENSNCLIFFRMDSKSSHGNVMEIFESLHRDTYTS